MTAEGKLLVPDKPAPDLSCWLKFTFKGPGSADCNMEGRNVIPIQMLGAAVKLAQLAETLPERVSGIETPTLELTFDAPGSAQFEYTLYHVSAAQLRGLAAWLDWKARNDFAISKMAEMQEAAAQQALLKRLSVPGLQH